MEGMELLDHSIRRATLAQYAPFPLRPQAAAAPPPEATDSRIFELEKHIAELTRRLGILESRLCEVAPTDCAAASFDALPGNPLIPTMRRIAANTAFHYGLGVEDLLVRSNYHRIAYPRQIAMYLCRTMTVQSLPNIGGFFGRDHSTILFAIRKIKKQRETDHSLDKAIIDIQRALAKPIAVVE